MVAASDCCSIEIQGRERAPFGEGSACVAAATVVGNQGVKVVLGSVAISAPKQDSDGVVFVARGKPAVAAVLCEQKRQGRGESLGFSSMELWMNKLQEEGVD